MGYACGPSPILSNMCKIHQYTMLCAPTPGQYAALEALENGLENDFSDVSTMVRSYDRRRHMVMEGLRNAGLDCFEPEGAFYAFPSIEKTGLSSQEFCTQLLNEQKVACVPGDAFGSLGEGHIRLSYATDSSKLALALERMRIFMEEHTK